MAEQDRTVDDWNFQSAVPKAAVPRELRTDMPHLARIYDYWLGGKNNYPADRAVAEAMIRTVPEICEGVRVNRAFLRNAVHFLAADCGIRQFLDIGTGLPAADNTHEVAQRVAADARIVYVDNDPLVLLHARALLTSTPEGVTAYLDGDVRDPASILEQAAATLDLTQPVALMLVALMHAIPDDQDPYAAVCALREAVAPGSYLVLSHLGLDVYPERTHLKAGVDQVNAAAPGTLFPRTRDQVARFFDGWELIDPGLVPAPAWRMTSESVSAMWAGVARKPAA
ncbi:SAM-dependent methyltransferase [Frankia nepalensis]|uniref:SAM-dependent methyltransferase n=1 Tax=Frankia nepalensis TaxID=1836974 RepID=UPI0027DE1037|nr:SAM-dependent methyltransferase [Frankia nepalensis]